MADTLESGALAGNESASIPAAISIPSAPTLGLLDSHALHVDAMRRGLALLLSTVAIELDNLRDLVLQTEPGDPSVHAVLGDLLALNAWRCDVGARKADPHAPLRKRDVEHFFDPELVRLLELSDA